MEERKVTVKVKNVAQTPQKLRLVADLVRGKNVEEALDNLQFTTRKGCFNIKKSCTFWSS
jgi:large subunit ribosomal protein L22